MKSLYEKGLFNNGSADRLNIIHGRVAYELGKFGLKNKKEACGVRSVYTENDYLKVLNYFKTHTAKETQKKFKDVKCESGFKINSKAGWRMFKDLGLDLIICMREKTTEGKTFGQKMTCCFCCNTQGLFLD